MIVTIDNAALSTQINVTQVEFNDDVTKWTTDSDGIAFYISQLAQLEATVYEAKYSSINFEELIPVITDIPEYVDTWEYLSYDSVTMGKFIGSSADDLPNISLSAAKSSVPINYAGNMYSYSLDEMRKSAKLGIPIDATSAKIAYRGSLEHTQQVAYFGDAERKMTGLFNNPNLAVDNSTVDWNTATGAELVEDMNSMGVNVWINSANVHLPDTWVIDSARFAKISAMRMDSGTDTTVLEFFKKNNIYTSITGKTPNIHPRLQLAGAGAGGKARMMCYEKNAENLGMANPIPWRPQAPQPDGLRINVACEYKISGAEFRFPFCGAYRDHR